MNYLAVLLSLMLIGCSQDKCDCSLKGFGMLKNGMERKVIEKQILGASPVKIKIRTDYYNGATEITYKCSQSDDYITIIYGGDEAVAFAFNEKP
jgi:hypothetical protein